MNKNLKELFAWIFFVGLIPFCVAISQRVAEFGTKNPGYEDLAGILFVFPAIAACALGSWVAKGYRTNGESAGIGFVMVFTLSMISGFDMGGLWGFVCGVLSFVAFLIFGKVGLDEYEKNQKAKQDTTNV